MKVWVALPFIDWGNEADTRLRVFSSEEAFRTFLKTHPGYAYTEKEVLPKKCTNCGQDIIF